MTLDGVDYSRTANADWDSLGWALKNAGRHFAGRYAVGDKAPGGRGITAAEYRALTDAGVEVFLYWQTTTNWMLGGWNAGVNGALNAQANIVAAGMPPLMPVYFACDFDAAEWQQAVIDECLRGAASILGADRVGLYGGYHVLRRAKANGSAAWFCQTSAWSGGLLMDGVHLYQHAYNQYIYGTNCDWVRAYQDNYGQASRFVSGQPTPEPAQPEPIAYPTGIDRGLAGQWFGIGVLHYADGRRGHFAYHEDRPWAEAWRERGAREGTYPPVVGLWQYQDAPGVVREFMRFEGGWTLRRLNEREPWEWADDAEAA